MSAVPTQRADVVIVGAGLIGLSIAFELIERGRRVLVLERGRVGAGASSAAAGMLAPVSEAESAEPELVRLAQDSLRRYPDFVARVQLAGATDCAYRDAGTLWTAVDRDNLEELERLAGTLRLKQLEPRPLSAGEVRRLEPHLSSRVLGGLFVAGDHQVDPRALLRGLERAVVSRGGEIRCATTVREIRAENGRATGVLAGPADDRVERIDCADIVLAAGSWSQRELRGPLPALGLRPVKGQLVRLRGGRLLEHPVRTPEVYLVPQQDGELLVGATMEETGFDETPTAGAVGDLLRRAFELLPGIYDLRLEEICVGLRPAFDDHLPVLGGCEVTGLHLALGHFRHGVLLAPATAAYLAGSIAGGGTAEALRPFEVGRLTGARGSAREVGR